MSRATARKITKATKATYSGWKTASDKDGAWVFTPEPLTESMGEIMIEKIKIIPQSFVARTNVPRLALFHSTSLLAMAPRFSTVRQLFIESSEQPMASLTNRIPIQSGFFKHFQEVQFIKISNVGENLSLMYTLEELFSLPKLEVLHVREFKNNIALPRPCVIKAPLKELRLAIRLTKINRLEDIFDNLSGTLESLELVPLKTNSAIENNLGRHLFSMILMHLPDLKDVYLSHIITEHPSFRQNLHLLKTFSQLKSITFELMHLESLSDVLSNLPSTCETVVVTEAFYIQGETIGLAIRARFKWEQLFSSKRIELLQNELNGIRRKITIQLGRLRETCQITMCYKVTPFVTFVSNVTTHFPELLTLVEKRVFLFNTVIYKRENFLKKLGIVTNDSVS
ncbi:hypothetical protein FO519_007244 [Halicephalobus sp. NKZ332]|nr:hypothetical protein FO519_007244 [Halicephalobus sp. NKZ332]